MFFFFIKLCQPTQKHTNTQTYKELYTCITWKLLFRPFLCQCIGVCVRSFALRGISFALTFETPSICRRVVFSSIFLKKKKKSGSFLYKKNSTIIEMVSCDVFPLMNEFSIQIFHSYFSLFKKSFE